ncbi:FAD-dependent oxidoreductase [Actinomadura sp. BRA 177]|uniref:FAD-dependent oxidoreductase n=1 Tax=Actinomadura sp. BRA 177 TaxID=2745202 RepID=UPI001596090D|nr:FAD-dependent oxidoreductase [Actinomadura sp. BRA 177]NVI86623.1 NAD(P)-binding domain-containing protein [Actinomadura sp. BRA 177]
MSDSASDVVIAGAGPYGLSTAAHLQNLGLDVRTIGEPMRFWEANMPEGMFLKSEPFASNLGSPQPGMRFTDLHPGWRIGQPIPLETFVEYGRWFAAEAVPQRPGDRDAQVVNVERARPGGYAVTLSTGETIAARAVVVAVGVGPFAHIPDELAGMPSWLVSHSSAHRDLTLFAGKDVAVIGAGQSALETAVLLADAGAHPHVIARRPELDWNTVPQERRPLRDQLLGGPRSGLGTGYRTWLWAERPGLVRYLPEATRRRIVRETLPPAGSWWLRDRLDERVRVSTGRRVAKAVEQEDGLALTTVDRAGRRLVTGFEHVLTATGYVPDVARLGLLAPDLRGRIATRLGAPVLSRDFEASTPGLYFAGLAAASTFGPVMRFVHGADFAATRIAHHIIRRTPRQQPPRARLADVLEPDTTRQ